MLKEGLAVAVGMDLGHDVYKQIEAIDGVPLLPKNAQQWITLHNDKHIYGMGLSSCNVTINV